MADKLWKAAERASAALFNTRRTPLSGSNSGHETESDSLHDVIYIETKRDKTLPGKKLRNLWEDTQAKAKKEGKIPVIMLRLHGKKGFLMLMHSSQVKDVAKEMV